MIKYEMIANKIRQRIQDGVYLADSLIPDQVSLAKEFKVSRMTVKKAMDVLAFEGLIFRKRGSGTYVKKTALKNGLNANLMEYEGLTQQLSGHEVKSQVISFTVEFPDDFIRETLMLDKHDPVYKIIRLRIVDGDPYIIEHTFMSVKCIPGLSEEALDTSVYQYIHNELGLQFGGAYRKIHAAKSSEYDQEYLGCAGDDPVLEVEQVVHLEDGTPFEYSRSRNRYDKRSYTVVDLQK